MSFSSLADGLKLPIAQKERLEKLLEAELLLLPKFLETTNKDHEDGKVILRPHHYAWRQQVAKWCYDVVDHLSLSRSIVHVTMNILERYLDATATVTNKKEYECVLGLVAFSAGINFVSVFSFSSGLGSVFFELGFALYSPPMM